MSRSLMLVVVMMLLVGACGGDTPTAGPVTIETKADVSAGTLQGTFEVTVGADVLGCSSGTFVDIGGATGIDKVMTCESGSNAGTFTIVFHPVGPDFQNGPWSVLESSDDFAGLQGEGDYSVVDDPDGIHAALETLTGDIEYTS